MQCPTLPHVRNDRYFVAQSRQLVGNRSNVSLRIEVVNLDRQIANPRSQLRGELIDQRVLASFAVALEQINFLPTRLCNSALQSYRIYSKHPRTGLGAIRIRVATQQTPARALRVSLK